MNKKILPAAWLASIVVLAAMTYSFDSESTRFYGLADNREQSINFPYPVEIMQNMVIEGQQVDQGETIVKLHRPDLNAKRAILVNEIAALKSRHQETMATISATITDLRAQNTATLAELDGEIRVLQSRLALNKQLITQISGKKNNNKTSNPQAIKLQELINQRRHIQNISQAEINNLETQLQAGVGPFDAELAARLDKQSELDRQAIILTATAKFNGRIGSVNFKPGEQVAPFEAVLTLHALSPKYVSGFIHENIYNSVAVGQTVWVQSTARNQENTSIKAVVESLGRRIVAYPVRLTKNPQVPAYGREAKISLLGDSDLLLGEKVLVTLEDPAQQENMLSRTLELLSSAISASYASMSDNHEYKTYGQSRPIQSNIVQFDGLKIEASGIVKDLRDHSYLVITDEKTSGQTYIYRMDEDGNLTGKMAIEGDSNIDDMESISRQGEYIYIAASLSVNKKGKLKRKRRLMMQLEQSEHHLKVKQELDLYKVLKQLSSTSEDPVTRRFLSTAIRNNTVNIESHSVQENTLYIGFKSPLNRDNGTVIIAINNFRQLFAGEPPVGKIWNTISLYDPDSGELVYLSDMAFVKERLLLLTVNKSKHHTKSHMWSYKPDQNQLTLIYTFDNLQAEGITPSYAKNKAVVVFDGSGNHPSQYMTVEL